LRSAGHTFATDSDCEVILHLYEDHGDAAVNWLRGMFAFALWDERRTRLLLARDRMGEKPLYLYESAGRLLFASELQSLLRSGLPPKILDVESVQLYFLLQYVPEPRTALRGVRKLAAGNLVTVEMDPWRVRERPYWRLTQAAPMDADPATAIRAELEN